MGATTIIVARDQNRGEQTLYEIQKESKNENVDLFLCDFSSEKSIRDFADSFKNRYDRLDILVNNAGLMNHKRIVNEADIELTFAVNHLGYFLTTHLLLDTLKENSQARIVVVSSDAHLNGKIDMNNLMHKHDYNGFDAYCDTKLANLMFTYKMAENLKGTQVTINALHPGVVKTRFSVTDRNSDLTFPMGIISPEMGAETQIYLSTSDDVADISGKYFDNKQIISSSPISYDKRLADKLWEKSIELTNLQ